MSILFLSVEIHELITKEEDDDAAEMAALEAALDIAIKKIHVPKPKKDPSPSPSPSPPTSRAPTLERDHSEGPSSVGGNFFLMEVSQQERKIILQTRELVSDSVRTVVRQRDEAHRRCDTVEGCNGRLF